MTPPKSMPLSRREFAGGTLLGAALAACASDPAVAQEPLKKLPGEASAKEVAERQLQLLQLLYPERLTREHLVTLREKLERQYLRSRLLSAYPLTNADEPALKFAAYRADG